MNDDNKCDDFGFKCYTCPLWNKGIGYCTKYKIWSDTGEYLSWKNINDDKKVFYEVR